MIRLLSPIPSLLSLLSFLYVAADVSHEGYVLQPILPLSYFFVYQIFLYPRFKNETTIFFKVFTAVSFMRYVVMPATIVYADYYGGRSPTMPASDSFQTAIILMTYELIILAVAVGSFERSRWKQSTRGLAKRLTMSLGLRRNLVFVGVVFVAAAYLLVDRSWLLLVNFFLPNQLDGLIVGTEGMFGAYMFIVLKQWFFVYSIYYVSLRANKWHRSITVLLILILVAINVGVFMGTNRSDVLVTAIVSMLFVRELFPISTISLVYAIGAFGVFVLISEITITREHSTITKGYDQMKDVADFQQVYLGGVYNVAIAIETKEYFPEASNLEVMMFDFIRPMIGVNLLVKNMDIKYSNIYFNSRLWHSDRRSQIIPMIGQGNLFLGPILAPLFGLLFVFLAYWLIHKSSGGNDPLMMYFFTLSIARMGFLMGQNSMNMINDLSFNLFLFLIIYFANRVIKI